MFLAYNPKANNTTKKKYGVMNSRGFYKPLWMISLGEEKDILEWFIPNQKKRDLSSDGSS